MAGSVQSPDLGSPRGPRGGGTEGRSWYKENEVSSIRECVVLTEQIKKM